MFRHSDHKLEMTEQEFRDWCESAEGEFRAQGDVVWNEVAAEADLVEFLTSPRMGIHGRDGRNRTVEPTFIPR